MRASNFVFRWFSLLSLILLTTACSSKQEAGFTGSRAAVGENEILKYDITYDQELSDQFLSGIPITPGSGLAFIAEDDGSFELLGLGDKGPKAPKDAKKQWKSGKKSGDEFYIVDDYAPFMARIRVDKLGAKIEELIPFKDKLGNQARGPFGDKLQQEDFAIDAEGLSVESEGRLWVVEENFPSLHLVEANTGTVLDSLYPGDGLPDVLNRRRFNRGFEAVARFPDGRLLASLQSNYADARHEASRRVMFVEVDPKTRESRMHTLEVPSDFVEAKNYKIGAGEYFGDDTFLFVEQGKTPAGFVNRIVRLSISDSQVLRRQVAFDLRANGWDESKAEGLSVSPSRRYVAIASDNDFGVLKEPGADGTWIDSEERSQLWLIPVSLLQLG